MLGMITPCTLLPECKNKWRIRIGRGRTRRRPLLARPAVKVVSDIPNRTGDVTAAGRLGISRRTFHRKINEMNFGQKVGRSRRRRKREQCLINPCRWHNLVAVAIGNLSFQRGQYFPPKTISCRPLGTFRDSGIPARNPQPRIFRRAKNAFFMQADSTLRDRPMVDVEASSELVPVTAGW